VGKIPKKHDRGQEKHKNIPKNTIFKRGYPLIFVGVTLIVTPV
jgi:hypothetical protein